MSRPRPENYDNFQSFQRAVTAFNAKKVDAMNEVTLTVHGADTTVIDQWDIINGLLDSLDGALKILAVKRMTEAEEQQVCGYIDQIDKLRGGA